MENDPIFFWLKYTLSTVRHCNCSFFGRYYILYIYKVQIYNMVKQLLYIYLVITFNGHISSNCGVEECALSTCKFFSDLKENIKRWVQNIQYVSFRLSLQPLPRSVWMTLSRFYISHRHDVQNSRSYTRICIYVFIYYILY